jgi:hypothetical protein
VDAASGEPLKGKGTDPRSTLTSNGRVSLRRKRWQARTGGCVMPADALLDAAEDTVSLGARELCCRLNATGKSFGRTPDGGSAVRRPKAKCGATPHRVKGQGKRWDPDNAEAVIAIEALHQSDLWNQYWTTCAAQMN